MLRCPETCPAQSYSHLSYTEQDAFSCDKIRWLEDLLHCEHGSKEEPLLRLPGFGLGVSSVSWTTPHPRVGLRGGAQRSPPSPYLPGHPRGLPSPSRTVTSKASHSPNRNQRQTTGTTIFAHFRATASGLTYLKPPSRAAAPKLLPASPHQKHQGCFQPQLRQVFPITPPSAQVLLLPHNLPPSPAVPTPFCWDCWQEKGTGTSQPGPKKKAFCLSPCKPREGLASDGAARLPAGNCCAKLFLVGSTFPLAADMISKHENAFLHFIGNSPNKFEDRWIASPPSLKLNGFVTTLVRFEMFQV